MQSEPAVQLYYNFWLAKISRVSYAGNLALISVNRVLYLADDLCIGRVAAYRLNSVFAAGF